MNTITPFIVETCLCCKGDSQFGEYFCYIPDCENYIAEFKSSKYKNKFSLYSDYLIENKTPIKRTKISVELDETILSIKETFRCYSGFIMLQRIENLIIKGVITEELSLEIKTFISNNAQTLTRKEFKNICKEKVLK